MKKILVIDDEERVRRVYVRTLVEEGMLVREAQDASEALNILIREDIDLVLLDIKMPQIDGKVVFEVIREYDPSLRIIISSIYPIDQQKHLIPYALDYFDKSKGVAYLLEKITAVVR